MLERKREEEPSTPTPGGVGEGEGEGGGGGGAKGKLGGRYALGLVCIVLVNVLWVGSALLMQYIFTGQGDYDKPFFTTYISTGMFGFYLLGFFFFRGWELDLPVNLGCVSFTIRRSKESPVITLWRIVFPSSSSNSGDESDSNESVDEQLILNTTVLPQEGSTGPATGEAQTKVVPLTTLQIVQRAAVFCLIWFFANYFYNKSLDMTSVSSNSILSSTSSFFTLLIGVLLHIEKPTFMKALSVLLCIGGVVMVTLSDDEGGGVNTVWGDILALLSAIVYAFYVLYLAAKVPEGSVKMPMFFGFVGFCTLVMLWPLGVIFNYTGVETFELPSSKVFLFLLVNGLFGTVISDCLWAWTVLLTSPTVASVGMSLSVPMAMVADLIMGQGDFTPMYIFGGVLVIMGFLLCSLGDNIERRIRERYPNLPTCGSFYSFFKKE